MELIWSKPALISLLDIAAYVEWHFNQRLARKVVHDLRKAVTILKRFPGTGRKVEGVSSTHTVRCYTHGIDQIFYYTEGQQVIIILVWDSRKNPNELLTLLKRYC